MKCVYTPGSMNFSVDYCGFKENTANIILCIIFCFDLFLHG